jgi:hypothetical protein
MPAAAAKNRGKTGLRLWTDDYSSLFSTIKISQRAF